MCEGHLVKATQSSQGRVGGNAGSSPPVFRYCNPGKQHQGTTGPSSRVAKYCSTRYVSDRT